MLLNELTLLNKSKDKKLDYKKIGSGYDIVISELISTKKDGVVNKGSFKRINNYKITMTEKTLLKYLYEEGYLDELSGS